MAGDLRTNLANGKTWLRGLLIILFTVLYGVAEIVLWVIVVLQFGSQLITGAPMTRLLEFARGLNAYVYQILQFITYRSEIRPFPVGSWPAQGMVDVAEAERLHPGQPETAPAEDGRAAGERTEEEQVDSGERDQATESASGPTDEPKDKDAPH